MSEFKSDTIESDLFQSTPESEPLSPSPLLDKKSFNYNHALLLQRLNHELQKQKFMIQTIPIQTTPTPLFNTKLDLGDGISFSATATSQKIARAEVARQYFLHIGLSISSFEKVFSELEPSHTPLSVLNEFKQKAKGDFEITQMGGYFHGRLQLSENLVINETYPYFVDYKYAKHKLAKLILERASRFSEQASIALRKVSKKQKFYKGLVFPGGEEGANIEYKGHKNKGSSMSEQSVANLSTELGQQVCGFLNAGKKASLFVGIHNDTHVIQGIKTTSIDEFQLRIQSSILSRIEPHPENNFDIVFHEVTVFKSQPLEDLEQIPTRPDNPNQYTLYLENKMNELLNIVKRLPKQEESPIFLLELRVKALEEPTLFFFDNRPYIRVGNSMEAMSVSEMKRRIILESEFKQGITVESKSSPPLFSSGSEPSKK